MLTIIVNSSLLIGYRLIRNLLAFVFLLTIISYLLPITAHAACNPNDPPELRVSNPDCSAGLDQIEFIFTSVISVIVGLGFVAMLIMLIIAGIKYLTSGGEPKAVQSAHHTVTWALLGILFFAIAWLILQLIQTFTGIEVTTFDVRKLCQDALGRQFCNP